MSAPASSDHPCQRLIYRSIEREWQLRLIAATLLLLFGAVLLYFFFDRNSILAILGVFCLFLGVQFGWKTYRHQRPERHQLTYLLEQRPRDIVWVYSVVTQRMPFGLEINRAGLLYFKLINGDEVSISLREKDLRPVSLYLNQRLPHATFGYTADREQWFIAAPELLLRYPEKED